MAAANGYLQTVKYLIKHGARVNARHDEALKTAAMRGYLSVVMYLVQHGANIESSRAVMHARVRGHERVALYLITRKNHDLASSSV